MYFQRVPSPNPGSYGGTRLAASRAAWEAVEVEHCASESGVFVVLGVVAAGVDRVADALDVAVRVGVPEDVVLEPPPEADEDEALDDAVTLGEPPAVCSCWQAPRVRVRAVAARAVTAERVTFMALSLVVPADGYVTWGTTERFHGETILHKGSLSRLFCGWVESETAQPQETLPNGRLRASVALPADAVRG
ncbi:hypothetical protein GCM10009762_29340 [Dermacoccus barathri]|uniref:Uncharacterized protein n=1 Tax=Dermacoccus barathri TaxID=322601 RepID=A0ABN2CB90_9MICO